MKRVILAGSVLAMSFIGGCRSTPSPSSKIVAEVEAAGSGKLDGLDEGTIQNWLNQHSDVAKKIGPECGAVMKTAKADWANTTEGHVCRADAKVLFFTPKDLTDGHY